jgi:RHS repeat-associated protein
MEQLRYFYHPDHLGSSSWITDGSGNAIQHLHYLPFGEDWVDQRNSSWNAPYTFSGKEKDAETGYGYFGARYYDSGLSIWLSVDPMSDKYPSMSPYNYCANNPVMLVDPDGNEIRIYYKTKTGIAKLFEKPKYIVYTPGMQYNGNNEFVKGTVDALNYVQKGDNLSIISKIALDTKKTVRIIESDPGVTQYDPLFNVIFYNNNSGMLCLDDNREPTGGKQSPALGLLHELGHTYLDFYESFFKNIISFFAKDDKYDLKEEKFVIENIETPAAKALNEGIRLNHKGDMLETLHSTTTEEK